MQSRSSDLVRGHDSPQTLAVFGNPRSGTTWLAEWLAKASGASILFEPFNVQGGLRTDGEMPRREEYKLAEVARLRFWYYQPIPRDASWPEAEALWRALLAGKITPAVLHHPFNVDAQTYPYPERARRLLIKFCYSQLMLPWVLDRFDVRGVFLLRHPCGVVGSQIRLQGWQKFVADPTIAIPRFRHSAFFDEFAPLFARIRYPEEHMAAIWAITVRHVLRHASDYPHLLVVRFEDITSDRAGWLERLSKHFGIEVSPTAVEDSYVPSLTCSQSFYEIVGRPEHVERWRSSLSSQQIERVLSVVRSVSTPDFDLLTEAGYGDSA